MNLHDLTVKAQREVSMMMERMCCCEAKKICDYGIYHCDAKFLLKYLTPWAYVSSNLGWSCDIYSIGDINISAGFRPVGKKINYDTVRKYEKIAEKIVYGESDFEMRIARLSMLRNDLLKEVRNHESGCISA